MAKKYLVPIDLNGNEIQNAVFQKLGTDPAGGALVEGLFWENTTTHEFKYYDGTTTHVLNMTALRARANHTGTQTASTISDFDTQVRTSRLDQMAAPSASVGLNNQKITSLASPTTGTDAANKNYVDNAIAGLAWKDKVRAATTAAGTLASSFENGDAIDGVTLATGDRILIKNQAAPAENGIYTVNASGAPTRATDADSAAELVNAAVFVSEGSTNADTAWTMTTNAPITLNTTGLTWAQFTGGSAPTAGAGLTLSGNTYAVGAGTGIVVNADDVAIDPAVVMRRFAADVGDNTSTSIDVTHNLNTKDVHVSVYDKTTPFAEVVVDVELKTVNVVTLKFAVAPTSAQYRAVVIG